VTVTLEVDRGSAVVAQIVSGPLGAGPVTVSWDRTGFGRPLPPGDYVVVLTVTDELGAVPFTAPLRIP
jgi:acyl-CoA hydrolase